PPHTHETPLGGKPRAAPAGRRAAPTGGAGAATIDAPEGVLVIGSDQVATFDGRQIGKPGTHERALAQLVSMQGRDVEFHTALSLYDSRTGDTQTEDVVTHVRFRSLPEAELDAYLRAETPYDVAGSAKSEGLGIALLDAIDSNDPTALVGLPLIALTRMLRAAGYPLFAADGDRA
ncbi:Maf family protein, partial [Burkholderia dolosa]|uniref:Maf family protein n=1 Tax=Burkholderia dolosa TaxID=152500 RepID=UPI001C9347F1